MTSAEQKRQRLSRNLTLLASGMFIWFGWNAGNAAMLLIGLFIPTFSLCCALIVMQQVKLLRVTRKCVDCACEGDRVDVTLTVRNPHWFPIFRLMLIDKFEPDLEAEKMFGLAGTLPGKAEIDFDYNAECYLDRGRYTLGPVTLEIAEPLGMFIFRRTIDLPQPFSVFPHVYPLPPSPLGDGNPSAKPEGLPVARAGDSDLQYGVREYAPGDRMRHIHWPQSAKLGELMVREYEQVTPANAYLLLDLPLSGRAGTGKYSTEEYGVQLVASLAAQILQNGQPAGVLINAEPTVFIEMDYGRQHLLGILDSLIPVRETSKQRMADLLPQHPEVTREGTTFWLIMSRVNFSLDALDDILDHLRWKPCRLYLAILDDEGMMAFTTSPKERAARPDRHQLAAHIGERVNGVWWIDVERGLEKSMKGGPL